MRDRPRLVAAGYINVDLVARVPRLLGEDGRLTTARIETQWGGMAANVACGAARFGADAELFGRVGDDSLGAAILADLRAWGVDVSGVVVEPGVPTTRTLILADPDGQRLIVSEAYRMDLAALAERLRGPGEGAAFYTSGYHLLEASPIAAGARKRGWLTVADLDGLSGTSIQEQIVSAAASLDLLVMNRRVAEEALPADRWPEFAGDLLRAGLRAVCITMGADGVLVADRDGVVRMPGHRVSVVDSTGAGDVFVAALAVMVAEGHSPRDAAAWANVAAALSTTGAGARGHLPTREKVETVLLGSRSELPEGGESAHA